MVRGIELTEEQYLRLLKYAIKIGLREGQRLSIEEIENIKNGGD